MVRLDDSGRDSDFDSLFITLLYILDSPSNSEDLSFDSIGYQMLLWAVGWRIYKLRGSGQE